jgi:hypothetical protein
MSMPLDIALVSSLSEEALAVLAKRLHPYWRHTESTVRRAPLLSVADVAAITTLHERSVRDPALL